MTNQTIKGMRAPELRKLFEETVNDINKIKTALDKIEEQKKQASDAKIAISGNEASKGILGDIKDLQAEADEKLKLIREAHAELLGDDEDESDEGLKGELDDLLEEFQSTQAKIKTAEKELYGYEGKSESGENIHIEGLTEKIKKFFDVQNKKYTEIYNKIENELLAGATTVGLSKAYDDKADSYNKPNRFWLIGFFLSVAIIIIILLFSLSDINKHFFQDNGLTSFGDKMLLEYYIIKSIIKIGIISSLVWAASFMGKRYNQNKRLLEEYSYKATFAKSFEGYRKRAEELDKLNEDKKLSEKLMDNLIQMNAYNPVNTMESKSHKEKHPTMSLLEKSIDTFNDTLKMVNKKL